MMDHLHQAASFDWETLAPVIFFILYGLAQLLGSKKKKPGQDEEQGDVDPVERARQIREEIRRKIEERRQENEPGTTRPVHLPQYDPTLSETRPRPVVQTQQRQPAPQPSGRGFDPGPEMNRQARLQQQLAEQRQRLELAKQEQRKAKLQAQRMLREAGVKNMYEDGPVRGRRTADRAPVRERLLRGLRENDGLRTAVLFREILDPPLGLR